MCRKKEQMQLQSDAELFYGIKTADLILNVISYRAYDTLVGISKVNSLC